MTHGLVITTICPKKFHLMIRCWTVHYSILQTSYHALRLSKLQLDKNESEITCKYLIVLISRGVFICRMDSREKIWEILSVSFLLSSFQFRQSSMILIVLSFIVEQKRANENWVKQNCLYYFFSLKHVIMILK